MNKAKLLQKMHSKGLGKREGDPSWIAFECAQDRGQTIPDSPEKSNACAKGAAIDPDLAELISNWASLPAIIRSAILAVARQHLGAP
jgi:hypothetical protein